MKSFLLKSTLCFILLSIAFLLSAQVSVSGRVIGNDAPDGLVGAIVVLSSEDDEYGLGTEESGYFTIEDVLSSVDGIDYELKITFDGYQDHLALLTIYDQSLNLGNIRLNELTYRPRGVTATPDAEGETATINWHPATPPDDTWLHWDGEQSNMAVGGGSPLDLISAIRFTPQQLEDRNVTGMYLTRIQMLIYQAGNYWLKVYQGGSGDPLNPGEEIVSQLVSVVFVPAWNNINLQEPVYIEPGQELWFGYRWQYPGGEGLAGHDIQPAVDGYGNLIYIDNHWSKLTSFGIQGNWHLQGYAEGLDGETVTFGTSDDTEHNSRETTDRTQSTYLYRELEGYEVYRLNTINEDNPDNWEYLATVSDTMYIDETWDESGDGFFKYAVRSVYTNEVYSDFASSNLLEKGMRYKLSGRIIASDTSQGLQSARISFSGPSFFETITDNNGNFTIDNILGTVEETEYKLNIKNSNYNRYYTAIMATYNDIDLGDITLNETAYPARNAFANLNEDLHVDVNWETPLYDIERWINWDSGISSSMFGSTTPANYTIASRFTPDVLVSNNAIGMYLTAIRFFPYSSTCSYTVKVWRGGSGDPLDPGEELLSQPIDRVYVERWNEIILDTPIKIESEYELWFGINIDTQGYFSIGIDSGPPAANRGNIIKWEDGDWVTVTDLNPDLRVNWNLHGFVGYTRSEAIAFGSNTGNISTTNIFSVNTEEFNHQQTFNASVPSIAPNSSELNRIEARSSLSQSTRALEGYNVFRLKTEDENDPDQWELIEELFTSTTYNDTGWDNIDSGFYKYAIVAVYTNNIYSYPTFTNEVEKYLVADVSIEISTNSEDPVKMTRVRLINEDRPNKEYIAFTPETGIVEFVNVIQGNYTIEAKLNSFIEYGADNVTINTAPFDYEITLIEDLAPVTELTPEIFNDNNVRLRWSPPQPTAEIEKWISWDTGNSINTIGTGGTAEFIVANRFSTENISDFDVAYMYLSAISFFPTETNASYTIKVWKGGSIDNGITPGTEVHSQQVNSFAVSTWNTVELSNTFEISPDSELWFGYHVSTPTGRPIGTDDGPAVNYYGNLIFFNGEWMTLIDMNPDRNYNWSLHGYVSLPEDIQLTNINRFYNDRKKHNNRELLGYKILRDEQTIAEDITTNIYADISLTIGNYIYSVIAQYTTGESEPVHTDEIIILSTDETYTTPKVTGLHGNYPNPFNPDTKISFSLANEDYIRINVYNLLGQRVTTLINDRLSDGHHTVTWNGKNDNGVEVGSGVYLYKMESTEYSSYRKMILMK